jgi:enoyl-CoA hydratase/carnithine racemase
MPFHYEKRGAIAYFSLDNPPVNVFTPAMHKQFFDALRDFCADTNVHVGVWAGVGERSFCAGDDIKSPRLERTTEQTIERQLGVRHEAESLEYPGWESEVIAMTRHKPIVGAVNGHCLGQGFIYLMLMTDIRIASPNASFGLPEIAYGMGGAGGMMRLSRQIPHSAAMWMLLTGKPYDAEQALQHSIINEVVPMSELHARAEQLAEGIAAHPPLAVRTEMEAYYRGQDMTRADAQAFTAQLYRLQRLAFDPTPPLATVKPGANDD